MKNRENGVHRYSVQGLDVGTADGEDLVTRRFALARLWLIMMSEPRGWLPDSSSTTASFECPVVQIRSRTDHFPKILVNMNTHVLLSTTRLL